MKIGSEKLMCGRKYEIGLNMQAICDDKRRFIYIDIHMPGTCSGFFPFETYNFRSKPEEAVSCVDGMVFIGDNAYVKCKYMVTRIKNARPGFKDDYNFYHSQCIIIIECAFSILVLRWGILQKPLLVGFSRVVPLMACLCKLHNFCIDNEENVPRAAKKDLKYIQQQASLYESEEVCLDEFERPKALLNCANSMLADTKMQTSRLAAKEFDTNMDGMVSYIFKHRLHRPLKKF